MLATVGDSAGRNSKKKCRAIN